MEDFSQIYPSFNKHSLRNIAAMFSLFLKTNHFFRPFSWILMKLCSKVPEQLLLSKTILSFSKYWLEANDVTKNRLKIAKYLQKKLLVFFSSLKVQMLVCYLWGDFCTWDMFRCHRLCKRLQLIDAWRQRPCFLGHSQELLQNCFFLRIHLNNLPNSYIKNN